MSIDVTFKYVAAGATYTYKTGYADEATALADAAALRVPATGYWYRRPDDPTDWVTAQVVFSSAVIGVPVFQADAFQVDAFQGVL